MSYARYALVAEVTQILKRRWRLESFGARTEELLRNALLLLSELGLTLLELTPLLTDAAFRQSCLKRTTDASVREYFENRFDTASPAMQAVMRDPVLNKVSEFVSDPRFRHILGQAISTFSIVRAMDQGQWIILNLDKGRLGEHSATLGSLFLSKIKSALFARKRRDSIFTLYCDEIQNLVAYDSGLETLLSEARKFAISVTCANQYTDQYPAEMRSAILAIGTHILFQLSSTDAEKMAQALDGGKPMAERLKNLPQREMIVKSEHYRSIQARVSAISIPTIDFSDLYNRCRMLWARRRTAVEQEIQSRQAAVEPKTSEVLNDWE